MRRRLIEGVPLILAVSILARAISFFSTIVLARLLAPTDFGLITMAMLVFLLITLFTDRGLPMGLVQSQADTQRVADTGFILLSGIGVVGCGLIVLSSPLVEGFFGQEGLAPVVVVLAFAYLLHTLGHTPVALLSKRLDYRRRALPEIVGSLTQAIVSVALAVGSQGSLGVWALAWGQVAHWAAWTTCGWLLANWHPRWQFDRAIAKDLLTFTRDMVGLAVLIVLIRNLDNLGVAKFLGPEQLGFYVLAFNASQLPSTILASTINQVFFPAFSRLQHEPQALQELHRHASKLVAVLACPLAGLVVILAPDFVRVVYGDKWLGSVAPLQIMAIYGLVLAYSAIYNSLFTATDQRGRSYPGALTTLVVAALLLYPATQWGIVGVAALFSVASVIGLLVSQSIALRVYGRSLRGLSEFVRPTLAAASAAAVTSALFHGLFGALSLPLQVLMAAAMAVFYGGALLAIDREVLLALRQVRAWRSAAAGRPVGAPLGTAYDPL